MLTSLTIDNYTIIEHLEIDFHTGLNTITGQTGAGKSILLGALSSLSGDKIDVSSLLNPAKNGVIEASFDISNYDLRDIFENVDIDYENQITIRRVVAPTGKSRAFVNDSPVNISVLKELSDRLIDIHSQHQSLLLTHKDFQIKIVDSIAKQGAFVEDYRRLFLEHSKKTKLYNKALDSIDENKKRQDMLQHHVDEIIELNLKKGELAVVEEELRELTHSKDIIENLSLAHNLIDSDNGALSNLKQVVASIGNAIKYSDKLESINERINSVYIELKDIDNDIEDAIYKMELNPNRLEQLQSRLDSINTILYKHNAQDEEALHTLTELMEQELLEYSQGETSLESLSADISRLLIQISDMAAEISSKRQKAIPKIEKHVVSMMKQLGVKDARFIVDIAQQERLTEIGLDSIQFLFSANAVSDPRPINKVASGGEISRLMLALKGLLSQNITLPTIIFDEIDTGVSGNIADKMGDILFAMSESMQVINITHLPQIASKGKYHLYVYKDKQTNIKLLSPAERVEKIAEMLSGSNITNAAREQAKELLGIAP